MDDGQAVSRIVEIMLDGLRAGSASALPGGPFTGGDLRRYTAVVPPPA